VQPISEKPDSAEAVVLMILSFFSKGIDKKQAAYYVSCQQCGFVRTHNEIGY